MPTTFDQFWFVNNSNQPAGGGTTLTTQTLVIDDVDDDGELNRFDFDTINGQTIDRSYPNQTITVRLEDGSQVTYSGVAFTLNDGSRVFTPTGNQVLPASATYISSTSPNRPRPIQLDELGPTCFAQDTLIRTSGGDVPIQTLAIGDKVLVEGPDGPVEKAIAWIGQQNFDAAALERNPKLRPIRITAGALGNGLPQSDLVVSRQHRMLVTSRIAQRMFDHDEVLIAAIHLTGMPGIFVDEAATEVTYFHMLFDRHEIVFAHGARTESLHVGRESLKMLDPEAVTEIAAIFPHLIADDMATPARAIPAGKDQKRLVQRHIKNAKPVVELTP